MAVDDETDTSDEQIPAIPTPPVTTLGVVDDHTAPGAARTLSELLDEAVGVLRRVRTPAPLPPPADDEPPAQARPRSRPPVG